MANYHKCTELSRVLGAHSGMTKPRAAASQVACGSHIRPSPHIHSDLSGERQMAERNMGKGPCDQLQSPFSGQTIGANMKLIGSVVSFLQGLP